MITEKNILICGHGSDKPSLKEMHTYLESRYNSYAPNGKRKQLVAVRRRPKTSSAQQTKFHDTYKTILGRNVYNQNLRNYVYKKYKDGNYYSDCSSSGCYTYKQFTDCADLNTASMYTSWEVVPVEIYAGHIKNLEVLQVGDALLFAGNDPNRPLQIGHVEYIYQITEEELKSKEIDATLEITSDLNIRKGPSTNYPVVGLYKRGEDVKITAKSGDWFLTDKGWISRKYTIGWIKEDGKWWYMEKGSYPMYCIREIDGQDYAFDRDGWMIESKRIAPGGAILK